MIQMMLGIEGKQKLEEQLLEHKSGKDCGQREVYVLAHLGSIFMERSILKGLKQQRIVTRATGLTNGSKNNRHFVDPPYHIDQYYTAYLHTHPQICQLLSLRLVFSKEEDRQRLDELRKSEEYRIFQHFVKEYYLIDAHKFGGLFLAYAQDYQTNHAQFIIFKGGDSVNHMTRSASSCKKEALHAEIDGSGEVVVSRVERIDDKKKERRKELQRQKEEQGQQRSKKVKEE